MSSIYKRNGIWQIQFMRDRKLVQRSLRTKNLVEAKSRQKLAEAELSKPKPNSTTIAELAEAYEEHAKTYYRKNGKQTSQMWQVSRVIEHLKDTFGKLSANEFGPSMLRLFIEHFIKEKLSRITVNKYAREAKRVFKWGVANELVEPSVYQALAAVESLKAGRSEATESKPVRPVLDSHIEKVKAALPPTLAALVDIQLLTAARPGELLKIRPCDIDRSGAIWEVNVIGHKTEHHGKSRMLFFGPKAQAILKPLMLQCGPGEFIFSPKHAITERNVDCKQRRRPGQRSDEPKTDRKVRGHYDTNSYRRAIMRACEEADVPDWTPNQLRHTAATRIRKQYGIDAAQVILGHSSADVTQVYAEVDRKKALDVVGEMG